MVETRDGKACMSPVVFDPKNMESTKGAVVKVHMKLNFVSRFYFKVAQNKAAKGELHANFEQLM